MQITYDAALSSYVPDHEIHPFDEGERYDLEFRPRERPALRHSRHALCDVVDLRSGVSARAARRSGQAPSDNQAATVLNRKGAAAGNPEASAFSSSNCFYHDGHAAHAVVTGM